MGSGMTERQYEASLDWWADRNGKLKATISDLQQRVSELERAGDRLAEYVESHADPDCPSARPELRCAACERAAAKWRRLRAGGET
jgi:hypothetical protein